MSNENPYLAPTARVAEPIVDMPEDIQKKIKHAWVAAIFSGTITLIVTLVSISGTKILSYSEYELFDVAFIFGLAFGIYKKSRTCAVLMLVYFIISKILLMMETGQSTGIFMAIAFGYLFLQGVIGTFAYHRLMRAAVVDARSA